MTEIGTFFAFSEEMVPEHGEDSYIYSFNENKGIIGVFDGCGGIGSKRYQQLESKTGAYISSRILSECMAKWFDEYSAYGQSIDISNDIKMIFVDALSALNETMGKSKIKGSMTKDFPSTISVTVFEYVNGNLYANFIWAGDSRGYILDDVGLTQITRDDIDNTIDPLENISSDGVLTNLVSADENYTLNSKKLKLRKKCIVFNATDGCFGYLKTPMEFEYLILNTLFDTNNIKEWVDVLKRCIREYTGDDYSIALAAMGFENYIELKKYYKNRFVELYNTYICKLKNADKNMVKNLWNNYKKVYERGMG